MCAKQDGDHSEDPEGKCLGVCVCVCMFMCAWQKAISESKHTHSPFCRSWRFGHDHGVSVVGDLDNHTGSTK